ncbi:MAG: hypothetical protein NVSMB14_10020 [Isosphaeraceae bacterium]
MNDSDDFDPYTVPSVSLAADLPEPNVAAERVRREYLLREGAIKAIALIAFAYAGGFAIGFLCFIVLGVVALIWSSMRGRPLIEEDPEIRMLLLLGVAETLGFGMLSWLLFTLGRGLYRLRPWARRFWGISALAGAASLVILPWFLPFPVPQDRVWMCLSAIVPLLFAFLVFSPRGSFLFTDEYRAIVAATPGVRLWQVLRMPKR